MLAYIAFRFRSLPFGVGAIVALVHDTLITVGLLALFGREFNLVVVAALLTLVGYSVNDTVVVYDRVRENLKTPKKEPLDGRHQPVDQPDALADDPDLGRDDARRHRAVLPRAARSCNTFALTLIIGIVVGTYSSIYVAAAIVVIWKDFAEPRQARRGAGSRQPAAAAPRSRRRRRRARAPAGRRRRRTALSAERKPLASVGAIASTRARLAPYPLALIR